MSVANESTINEFEFLNEHPEKIGNWVTYYVRIFWNQLSWLLSIFKVGKQKWEKLFSGDTSEIKIPRNTEQIIVTRFENGWRKSKIL